ncbi:GNAT family N-acetyltransferase [Planococcus sp. APC 4015]|nr:GNAT family N-acetyltransferase [Planococcus sp. APC 4015]
MRETPEIRRVFATDAARVRAIRLEALSDPVAPIAFLGTFERASRQPMSFWDDRAMGGALGDTTAQFIAEVGRAWVGTVTVILPEVGSVDDFGRVHPAGHSLLVAVYVAPDHRGTGVLADLVDAAGEWARSRGCESMLLDVHEDNIRAQAAYRRLGFVETGARWPGPNGTELEMVREG